MSRESGVKSPFDGIDSESECNRMNNLRVRLLHNNNVKCCRTLAMLTCQHGR
jgi:hypothetical protein